MKRRQVPSPADSARGRVGELFCRCSPDLHRYLRKRLRGSPDTADLIQEIFERFIRGDWRARTGNPAAYLFGIASNVVADAKMAQGRQAVVYDSEMVELRGDTLPSGNSHTAESVDLKDELMSALERLPDVHRAAILLTKRDGLSCKDAALKMGTTEGSVRVYVCEARAQLKMLLRRR